VCRKASSSQDQLQEMPSHIKKSEQPTLRAVVILDLVPLHNKIAVLTLRKTTEELYLSSNTAHALGRENVRAADDSRECGKYHSRLHASTHS
jgi:hypothetical protein